MPPGFQKNECLRITFVMREGLSYRQPLPNEVIHLVLTDEPVSGTGILPRF